jgi:hypothetical protein
MGSTIGPDGALYVTEGAGGRISRVDPQTGEKTTFASGLPRAIISIGGPIGVAFIDNIAYLTWIPFVLADPVPTPVEIFLVVLFLGAFLYYLGTVWKSRDDEGLSALRVPALAFAVLLLLVGCGVLMWR